MPACRKLGPLLRFSTVFQMGIERHVMSSFLQGMQTKDMTAIFGELCSFASEMEHGCGRQLQPAGSWMLVLIIHNS